MGLSAARKKLNDTQNCEKFQQNYLNIFSKIEKSNHVKFFLKKEKEQSDRAFKQSEVLLVSSQVKFIGDLNKLSGSLGRKSVFKTAVEVHS